MYICVTTLHSDYFPWRRSKAADGWLRSPVVDLLGRREALDGPVEEAVHEDETGKTRPHPHDHLEGHAGVVDQLGARREETRG